MTDTIIYLIISFLVSMIFVILGINQYKSQKPVTINTGLTPPKEEELTSVTEWNHRHGRDFILLGVGLFVTLTVFAYFLDKLDNTVLQSSLLLILFFIQIALVVIDHRIMEKKMIIKK